jgi:hypothetical protein
MQPPLLASLSVISDRSRLTLMRQMLTQLRRQSYTNIHVIIVNATGIPVFTSHNDRVIEITADPNGLITPAALRNIGINSTQAPWVILMDDDDVHHPQLFTTMMAHRRDGGACTLGYQLRVDISQHSSMGCLSADEKGIPGTMLFPRTVGGVAVQFDEQAVTDVERKFLDTNFGDQVVVIENDAFRFPGPVLHIAVWHGRNILSREAFFGPFADPQFARHWVKIEADGGPSQEEFDRYVVWAFKQRGLQLNLQSGGQTSESASA